MSLRVQSGTARGRLLKATPRGLEVRPILARVRKSLFDILRPVLPGALFLDLYCGTGMVGIEALSNGAARAVFVDADRFSLKMVQENTAHLGFASQAEVVRADVTRDLRLLGGRRFNVIFLGPPYKTKDKSPLALTVPTLARVLEAGLLAPDGLVVGQRHDKEPLEGLDPRWEKFRENKYGDTLLAFFRLR